jgi:hypothetical protein
MSAIFFIPLSWQHDGNDSSGYDQRGYQGDGKDGLHQVGHVPFSCLFKRRAYLKATARSATATRALATSVIQPCISNAPDFGVPHHATALQFVHHLVDDDEISINQQLDLRAEVRIAVCELDGAFYSNPLGH